MRVILFPRSSVRPSPSQALALIIALLSLAAAAAGQAGPGRRTPPAINSDEEMARALPRLSNWGRWGDADQLGTLNHLTPERVARAARLVRSGKNVSLSRRTDILKTAGVREGRHEMQLSDFGSRDYVGAVWHGFAVTHLDALCHVYAGGARMYGGLPTAGVTKEGCGKLGVEVIAQRGVAGRGVLLDVAELKGRPLEPGTPVYVADLEAAAKKQRVTVRPGDILFVRTGAGARNTRERRAGLHPECLPWLKEKEVALLGGDGDSDVAPLEGFDRWASALHSVGIPYLGLPLIDNAELDALGEACKAEGRWEFFVTVAPWNIRGATSAPINPLAIF